MSRTLLEQFEAGEIPAASFHHREHVQVAFEMLCAYEFVEACSRYAQTIRRMAASVGALEKYNTTITLAFLSLVAERKEAGGPGDFEAFIEANPDLLNRDLLDAWYSRDRLASAAARSHFVLPDRVASQT